MRRTAVLIAIVAGALAAVLMTSQASAWDCAPGTHDTGTACVPDNPTPPAGNPGQGHTPVTICHHAGPSKTFTIVVDDDAVPGHLGHGDTLGACAPPVTPPAPPVTPPGQGHTPVTICHHAGPSKTITITVDDDAVPAHLAHGDTRGACPPVTTPPVTTPTPPTTATPPAPPAAQPPEAVVAPVTTVTPPKAPAPVEAPETQPIEGPTPDAFPVRRHGHRGRHASSQPQRRAPVTRPVLVSAQTASGSLPFTGMDTGVVALLGAGMLSGGALLRRRTRVVHADGDVVARREGRDEG